jgi:hypothetical protein
LSIPDIHRYIALKMLLLLLLLLLLLTTHSLLLLLLSTVSTDFHSLFFGLNRLIVCHKIGNKQHKKGKKEISNKEIDVVYYIVHEK